MLFAHGTFAFSLMPAKVQVRHYWISIIPTQVKTYRYNIDFCSIQIIGDSVPLR